MSVGRLKNERRANLQKLKWDFVFNIFFFSFVLNIAIKCSSLATHAHTHRDIDSHAHYARAGDSEQNTEWI